MYEASKRSETQWLYSNWWKSLPWSCDYSPAQREKSNLASRLNFPKYNLILYCFSFWKTETCCYEISCSGCASTWKQWRSHTSSSHWWPLSWLFCFLYIYWSVHAWVSCFVLFFPSQPVSKLQSLKIFPLLTALNREQLFMFVEVSSGLGGSLGPGVLGAPHGVHQGRVWKPNPIPLVSQEQGSQWVTRAAPALGTGEQLMDGPGSAGPMVRQDRAVRSWRQAVLWCYWGRAWLPREDDRGSWAIGKYWETLWGLSRDSEFCECLQGLDNLFLSHCFLRILIFRCILNC